MKKIIRSIIFLVALFVFCYSAYNLFLIFSDNAQEYVEIEDIRNEIEVPNDNATADELEKWRPDFDYLLSVNMDVIGYIIVDETHISYPIVKGEDNDYYLNHSIYKNENYAGSIYLDYRANSDFTDKNTFIYGHNLYHGTMFAELANYVKESFYNAHPYIHLYTPNGNFKLQVFSAYVDEASSDSYRMFFSNDKEYEDYLSLIRSKARFDTDVNVNKDDRIVTLYTCSFETENPDANDGYIEDRYFIHCKLIKEF